MPREEDDDLYDEEFDFVDDDEDRVENEEEDARPRRSADLDVADDRGDDREDDLDADQEEAVDEYGRPEPVANYVVHIYEHRKFKRTIERPFTPEDAEAFATEYNRTSKLYGRYAMAGKNDTKPKKTLD